MNILFFLLTWVVCDRESTRSIRSWNEVISTSIRRKYRLVFHFKMERVFPADIPANIAEYYAPASFNPYWLLR
jgi:hypothetical protein